MGLERLAENRIREAMCEGAFDRLPGSGKPLDLEAYFKTPEDVRLAYSVLRSAGCLPEEVELLNEIELLERDMANAQTADIRRDLLRALAERRLRLSLIGEHRTRNR
jgi:hypothetical protein